MVEAWETDGGFIPADPSAVHIDLGTELPSEEEFTDAVDRTKASLAILQRMFPLDVEYLWEQRD